MKTEPHLLFFHVRTPLFYAIQAGEIDIKDVHPDTRKWIAHQGHTLCFERRKDGWWVAAATTNNDPDHPFTKRIGRSISKGRLQCKRKPELASFFSRKTPTFDDCLVIASLLEKENFYQYYTNRFGQESTDTLYRESDVPKKVMKKFVKDAQNAILHY